MVKHAKYKNAYNFIEDDDDTYSEELVREQDLNGGVDPNTVEPSPNSNSEEETWKERYANLRRHSQGLTDELKTVKAEVETLKRVGVKPPKTDEEFQAWIEKYPEASAFMKTLVMKELAEREEGGTANKLQELENRLATERAYNELLRRHPDFPTIQKDKKFRDWMTARAEKNPDDWVVFALHKSIDVDLADEAVTFYKSQNDIKSPDRKQSEKDSVTAVSGGSDRATPKSENSKFKFKESQIDKMSPKQFEKLEDEIMEAMRKGEVEMDLSGGMR